MSYRKEDLAVFNIEHWSANDRAVQYIYDDAVGDEKHKVFGFIISNYIYPRKKFLGEITIFGGTFLSYNGVTNMGKCEEGGRRGQYIFIEPNADITELRKLLREEAVESTMEKATRALSEAASAKILAGMADGSQEKGLDFMDDQPAGNQAAPAPEAPRLRERLRGQARAIS